MANLNVQVTETRRMSSSRLTVGDYRRLFEGLPDELVVDTQLSPGDRPWESGETSVSVHMPRSGAAQASDWTGRREASR